MGSRTFHVPSLLRKLVTRSAAVFLVFPPLLFATEGTAFGASAQVYCSGSSSTVSTLDWTLSGTPTAGADVTVRNLTISSSTPLATTAYDVVVTGASPSSFSMSKPSGSTNFGDYSFHISGSAGSTFSLRVSSIQTTTVILTTGCPGTMGSPAGTTTFISQSIAAAPTSTTNSPATTPATSANTQTGATSTNGSAGAAGSTGATAASGESSASSHDNTSSGAPSFPIAATPNQTSGATGTENKSTDQSASKVKHGSPWWSWLKLGIFWLAVLLALITDIFWWLSRRKKNDHVEPVKEADPEPEPESDELDDELTSIVNEDEEDEAMKEFTAIVSAFKNY